MSEAFTPVVAPLLSVNEPEARVVEFCVTVGQKVEAGDRLCTLETTKATFEVLAEIEGYVCDVQVAKGDQVAAGAVLCGISSTLPARPASIASPAGSQETAPDHEPEGLRITAKARTVARELGVALSTLPVGTLVTEALVRELSAKVQTGNAARLPEAASDGLDSVLKVSFDANQLIVLGAGGHAKTVIDLIHQAGHYHLAGLIADPPPPTPDVLGVPVLGGEEALQALYDSGIRLMVIGVGAIKRNRLRQDIFVRMAKRGFAFPRIVHPKAIVEPSVELAGGVQVFGMAFVGSAARVGFGAIVNTGAIVSHDCVIGDFAHLTPGVILAGDVEVGTGALIGMGVTTAIGVKIGAWARIGNGARINGDVAPHAIVQAGAAWP